MIYYTATRVLAAAAALSTLALMVYMAHPWGDNDAFQSLSGYFRLLLLAVWAILPYLVLFIIARRAVHAKAGEILILVGALIISAGGLAAYADAVWLHPDPQGGLAFMAVPLYQLVIVGLLAGLLWLGKKLGAL
jgi:hypothetical protein